MIRSMVLLMLAGIPFYIQAQYKKLIWADEFEYSGLPDSAKWSYDTGNHGWGNNELQYYTAKRKENALVSNGILSIKAIKEDYKEAKFTSARLVSKNKGDWKYGRIEVKAKMPQGRGLWPAIWMLPTDWEYGDWPKSGEIDIMEHVGYLPDSVFGTVHTAAYNHMTGTQKTKSVFRKNLASAFHVYAMEWDEDRIRIFIDKEQYFEFANEKQSSREWPFNKRFHLLLNIAVGGNWGGKMGVDEFVFPQTMEVDYVRVYQ
ncbi:glycoside hydrolase family 16 protein [Agriterribacter sp.]|uniref:glycoside hydrolase family 16 protein n=1 Tax=Agriterribacter sp. TaxID=2821509 RepID=UPI002CA2783D|nr:glycoside hydrolase family 16 protein [Agriterribacter sp.]HTN08306.1 glycoside hydrolase family 16 protein [Agriterribacter sp.]